MLVTSVEINWLFSSIRESSLDVDFIMYYLPSALRHSLFLVRHSIFYIHPRYYTYYENLLLLFERLWDKGEGDKREERFP
jgi:hypothetical protein